MFRFERLNSSAPIIACFALMLSSCGGGSSDDTVEEIIKDGDKPSISVDFPPSPSVVQLNTITARGSAFDKSSKIISIQSGERTATSDDDFANWELVLDLPEDENSIEIIVTDESGETSSTSLNLNVNRRLDKSFPADNNPALREIDSVYISNLDTVFYIDEQPDSPQSDKFSLNVMNPNDFSSKALGEYLVENQYSYNGQLIEEEISFESYIYAYDAVDAGKLVFTGFRGFSGESFSSDSILLVDLESATIETLVPNNSTGVVSPGQYEFIFARAPFEYQNRLFFFDTLDQQSADNSTIAILSIDISDDAIDQSVRFETGIFLGTCNTVKDSLYDAQNNAVYITCLEEAENESGDTINLSAGLYKYSTTDSSIIEIATATADSNFEYGAYFFEAVSLDYERNQMTYYDLRFIDDENNENDVERLIGINLDTSESTVLSELFAIAEPTEKTLNGNPYMFQFGSIGIFDPINYQSASIYVTERE